MMGGESWRQHVRLVFRDVVVNGLVGSPLIPRWFRWRLLRGLGLDVSPSRIEAKVFFGSDRISIGADTVINREVFLDGSADVRIGERTRIGMRVMVITSGHELGDRARRGGAPAPAPVEIGDGAWIGAGALILPGVTIAPGCVVAAGAVVTEDCTTDGMYAGVPARRVRDLPAGNPSGDPAVGKA